MKFLNALMISTLFLIGTLKAEATETIDVKGVKVTVEPVVGYEFAHSETPDAHVRGMLIYGGRATAGYQIFSLEAEYTRGNVSEIYATPARTIKTDKENFRLGVRSTKTLLGFLNTYLRFGGQASREKIDDSVSGSSNTSSIDPYAGTGIEAAISGHFSLTADATYVFNSLKNWSKNDIQTTLSAKIQFDGKTFSWSKH